MTSWSDWAFTVKAAARSCDRATDEKQDKVDVQLVENYLVDSEVEPNGSELFDLLVSLTGGEAITVVKGAEDMNGFVAWKRLSERFNPNTPAKGLALLMEVMSPTVCKLTRIGSHWRSMNGT